jgi:hypothetical protein
MGFLRLRQEEAAKEEGANLGLSLQRASRVRGDFSWLALHFSRVRPLHGADARGRLASAVFGIEGKSPRLKPES